MQINPQTVTQTLSVFVGNLPTFTAVLLASMHSNARMSDLKADIVRESTNTREILGAELNAWKKSWTHA